MSSQLYHLAFTYSPGRKIEPNGLPALTGAKVGPGNSVSGELKVAVTKEVVYSEWWFDGKLSYRQWDYPTGCATYYAVIGALTHFKQSQSDAIPLWLPTKDGARKFIRESQECNSTGDLCIETPGRQDEPAVGLTMQRIGPKVQLTPIPPASGFQLTYEGGGASLRSLEYYLLGYGMTEATGKFDQRLETTFKASALPALKELKIPDWRDFAPEAKSITYDGIGISYDSAKGTLEQQRDLSEAVINRVMARRQVRESRDKEGLAPVLFVGIGATIFILTALVYRALPRR